MVTQQQFASAADVFGLIETKQRAMQPVWSRMDADFDLYILKSWQPDPDEAIGDEDIYTTNAPRVLAEKIIAFISATVPVIVADNSNAQEEQEHINDAAEQLAIGMLNNADDHLRRNGLPTIQDQLAFHAVVRGRYAAARALLRKRPNGDTFEDILPLDPRQLVIQRGDGELQWAAYRIDQRAAGQRDQAHDQGRVEAVPQRQVIPGQGRLQRALCGHRQQRRNGQYGGDPDDQAQHHQDFHQREWHGAKYLL